MNNSNNTPLNLTVFGATGATGRAIVERALAAGHHVTALSRSPERFGLEHPRLRVVQGDVRNQGDVERTVRGQDAVMCALGAPAIWKTDLRETGTRCIVKAMKKFGVRRFICLSVMGIRDTADKLPLYMKYLVVPLYLGRAFTDHANQERVIEATNLDWTIVRPPFLTDEEPKNEYVHGEGFDPETTQLEISRADVANFMLRQLSEETYVGKRPSIGKVKRARKARAIVAPSR